MQQVGPDFPADGGVQSPEEDVFAQLPLVLHHPALVDVLGPHLASQLAVPAFVSVAAGLVQSQTRDTELQAGPRFPVLELLRTVLI